MRTKGGKQSGGVEFPIASGLLCVEFVFWQR